MVVERQLIRSAIHSRAERILFGFFCLKIGLIRAEDVNGSRGIGIMPVSFCIRSTKIRCWPAYANQSQPLGTIDTFRIFRPIDLIGIATNTQMSSSVYFRRKVMNVIFSGSKGRLLEQTTYRILAKSLNRIVWLSDRREMEKE